MEGKLKVAVTWPIDKDALSKLQERYEVLVNEKKEALSPEELPKFVEGASAILCLLTNKITAEVMHAAGSQLKIVATMSVGYDHIDRTAAKERNITVTNTPGTLDNAVAEHTIALIMALAKSLIQSDAFVRSGKYKGWDPNLFIGPELGSKVIGIVGLGHIGTTVARVAGFGLGMAIAYNDIKPNPEFEKQYNAKYFTLDELLSIADIVTLHVPLLPETKHLINAERLTKMKPTSYLINTARGPVVDEAALVTALEKKQIAGAGLDVYENEPSITPELLKLDNVVLTPHTASATIEARKRMAEDAVTNILAVLSGKDAPHVVKTD